MGVLVKIIKSIIFYPMLWLRKIIKVVLKLLSGLSFLSAIAYFVTGFILKISVETMCKKAVIMLILSFITFIISVLYDLILLKLNPTDTTLIL